MKHWWIRNPYYLKYMIRESTSVFVVIYALILLTGLWSLVNGKLAYEGWQEGLTHPISIAFHLLAMGAAIYHTITWFKVSPKVVPHVYISTWRIPDRFITGIQYIVAIVCYLTLWFVVGGIF